MRSLYASFDLYPSSKGAATHIRQFASTLFDHFGGGVHIVIGDEHLPEFQHEGTIHIHRFKSSEPNLLRRAEQFSVFVHNRIKEYKELELVHFRDIWSALGILESNRTYQTVFEVNGLPSIELPYRYPLMSQKTLQKSNNWRTIA